MQRRYMVTTMKQEVTANTVRKDHVTIIPYLHPYHKNQYFNQYVYQHRFEQKLLTYIPRKVNTVQSCFKLEVIVGVIIQQVHSKNPINM